MSQNNGQKQSGGGGFFASLALGLSNFGSAVTKSVNGYGHFFLVVNHNLYSSIFINLGSC